MVIASSNKMRAVGSVSGLGFQLSEARIGRKARLAASRALCTIAWVRGASLRTTASA